MTDLATFLRAYVAADEAQARQHYAPFEREWEWCPKARTEPLGDLPGGPDAPCECIVESGWNRALAECDAKRRIVDLHDFGFEMPIGGESSWEEEARCKTDREEWPCLTLRLLALPYADRPTYRSEWAL